VRDPARQAKSKEFRITLTTASNKGPGLDRGRWRLQVLGWALEWSLVECSAPPWWFSPWFMPASLVSSYLLCLYLYSRIFCGVQSGMAEIISRGLPNAVTYDISSLSRTTITLPAGSTWSSELHWHETHTEYLVVVKGSVRVRLGDKTQVVSPADGEIRIDRFVWHEWSRASPDGEDVVVIERTDPADGEKQLFFRSLNAVILRAQKARKPAVAPAWLFSVLVDFWITLNLCIIFQRFDNYPVFFNFQTRVLGQIGLNEQPLIRLLLLQAELLWTRVVLGISSFAGRLLQLDSAKRDYTREDVSQLLPQKGKDT
jgi:uncharacterized RmlC-like cupin family protein